MAIFRRKGKDGVPFGSYRISVYRGSENGKKLYHTETFDGKIQDARKREAQIKSEVDQGKYVKPGKLTLGEFLDRWLKEYSELNLSPTTHKVYKQQVKNHVKPQLGNLYLTSINHDKIADYYLDRLKSGLSATTVIHHHTMLHKAMQTAIKWGLIQHNPLDGTEVPKRQRPEMETFSIDEMIKFLETTKEHKPDYYCPFTILLHTGVRVSELLGLKWKDVDDLFNSISINRTLHILSKDKVVIREPKTKKSRRLIPLTPTASLVLKDYYYKCKDLFKKLDKTFNDDTFIFCHADTGKPIQPKALKWTWDKIAKIAKLKHIRLHDARHTHATILFQQGIHPKVVQERLGHSNISTTMDIYSHVLPSMQEAASKKFEEAFNPSYNNKVGNETDCQSTTNRTLENLENS